MLRKFAGGDEWFDVIVRLILDEIITALGIFAVMIVVHGFFAPKWLMRFWNGQCETWRRP